MRRSAYRWRRRRGGAIATTTRTTVALHGCGSTFTERTEDGVEAGGHDLPLRWYLSYRPVVGFLRSVPDWNGIHLHARRVARKGVLAFAEHVLSNMASLWSAANSADRLRLQTTVFPTSLVWSADGFGTAVTNPAFSWLGAVAAESCVASPRGGDSNPWCWPAPSGLRPPSRPAFARCATARQARCTFPTGICPPDEKCHPFRWCPPVPLSRTALRWAGGKCYPGSWSTPAMGSDPSALPARGQTPRCL